MIDAPTDDRPPSVRSSGSVLRRHGLTLTDGLVAALAFLLCIAFGPTMTYPSWTPRMALVLLVLPVGLLLLLRQARAGDPAARCALALGAWIVVAGCFSGAARSALVGFVARDLSALMVIGSLAAWSVGRAVGERGRRFVIDAVLVGQGLSLLVGVLQLLFDVQTGTFAMNGGRPSGLTSNPVYFGGLMVAATALAIAPRHSTPADPTDPTDTADPIAAAGRRLLGLPSPWWRLVAVGCFAAGVAISGSRVALGALLVVVGWRLARDRRRAIPAIVAAVAGYAVGTALQATIGTSADALSRATDGGGGLDGRREVWRYAMSAVGERPVFGWGFGRFQTSVQEHFTADFVIKYAKADLGVAWFDAHNIVVAVLDAIGPIGLVLTALWLATAVRRADSGLLAFPAALAITWMMQPAALPTLPIALLLLGAAQPSDAWPRPEPDAVWRRARAVALTVGAAAGAYLLIADVVFYRVTEDLDGSSSAAAARLYPGDPVVAGLVAQVWAIEDGSFTAPRAVDWQQRAVDRDPERPYWRDKLAERYLVAGEPELADRELDVALDLAPYHYESRRLKVAVAVQLADEARLRAAIDAACEVDAPECELDPDELLAEP